MPEVKRTLVKSAPELWAEVGHSEALARRLAPFGSVRVTAADPECLVEWEGDRARGAIRLEPSGFGTRVWASWEVVHLSPPPPAVEPDPPPDAVVEEQPAPAPAPRDPVRRSFWRRFLRRRMQTAADPPPPEEMAAEPEAPVPPTRAEPSPRPEPEPNPLAMSDDAAAAVLTGMLDALGSAHHRPFSRI